MIWDTPILVFFINFLRQDSQIDVLYVSFNAWDSQVSPLPPFSFFHFFIFLYGPFKCPFIRLKIHKTIEIKIFKNEYSYAESWFILILVSL